MNSCDDSVPAGDLASRLCQAMADIHRRGWCDGTGGNFSCVSNRDPLQLLMAPSGVDKGNVQPTDLIQVDRQGTVKAGQGRASAETELHMTIVEATGAGAVLHTHSQAATLLSRYVGMLGHPRQGSRADQGHDPAVQNLRLEGLEMLKGLEGITSHHQQIAIPVLANDQDLQRLSEQARPHLQEAPYGLLIGGHGLYAWGRDLGAAQRHLEILEFLLEQHWRQLLLVAAIGNGALS
ncbi:MAG: methylthioribulose 1-phosphate dehydratase [Cyanobium sp.]